MSKGIGEGNEKTVEHIREVQRRMSEVTAALTLRGINHDTSKLQPFEADGFNALGDKLKGVTYGSPEYKRTLRETLGPVIEHHYSCNSHHPEYYATYTIEADGRKAFNKDGIPQMSLFDLIEMLVDWKAASARHADGSLFKSFKINRERFGIPHNTYVALVNTAFELKWLTTSECSDLLTEGKE